MKKSDSEAGQKPAVIPRMKARRLHLSVSLISLILIAGSLFPHAAFALTLSGLFSAFSEKVHKSFDTKTALQTIPIADAAENIDPTPQTGGGDIIIVDESALMSEEGPSGTIADIERPKNSAISVYVVREGDTLSSIAALFEVSTNTIMWANDLKRGSSLKVGQVLTILPITGVKYTTKKGDTLASIAKKFKADADEIGSFNGISGSLAAGVELIIPDGVVQAAATPTRGNAGVPRLGTAVQIGFYMRPITGGTKTQGIHGYNGVDFGAPRGTAILASADGSVIVAKNGGYNGGYGSYVVVQHDNGSQTLYAHASSVIVGVGERVVQGQVIAYVGNTGRSTGPHLHFEIRNGIRNPF